jgi:hypothetical protein
LDYWLCVADQLERSGIRRPEVFDRAIAIIEAGEDLAMLKELEAEPQAHRAAAQGDGEAAGTAARSAASEESARPLKKPQPLLFEPGDALTWPTDGGNAINPLVAEDQQWKLGAFTPDGWGFGIITGAGHHFQVLAYYVAVVLKWRRPERPSSEIAVHCPRSAHRYGTLSALHMKRVRLERIGRVLDAALGPPPDPKEARKKSRRAALEDIPLAAMLGLDAWNHMIWPGLKFPVPAPSGTPLDPDEPDQRPDPKKA